MISQRLVFALFMLIFEQSKTTSTDKSVLEYFPEFSAAKTSIDKLDRKLTELKTEINSLKDENLQLRQDINAKSVAFYSYLSGDREIDWFSNNKVIIYDRVNLNIGSGYDGSTGIFTAPSSGTYVFNTVSVAYNKSYITLLLKINGLTADIAFPDAYNHDDRSTATTVTVVTLEKGDQVYTVNGDKKGGKMMESGDHDARCSFSGYRIY